jgi:VCBS repeat-containing protein
VDGNQSDNSASLAGAAYVFTRDGTGAWSQQAYLKASNTESDDQFGGSVAVDGDTAVVGARLEDSNATGVDGNQADNSAVNAGAAYVFTRDGTGAWSQQAYLKASNTDGGDEFGRSVAVAGDTVVVGASGEDSNATGVDGNQADNSAVNAGAAYVFTRDGTGAWSQQTYLKASNTDGGDDFGFSVAVDGDTVVIGAFMEASIATGVDGNEADNSASFAGAAYVFFGNEAPVAADDNVATHEVSAFFGDVLADNGNGTDSDPDGDPLSVTQVNGSSGDVGNPITLLSGALLVQNANGIFIYDPNGQFESLGTGDSATDSYTYTVSDGNFTDSATVTVTINGVDDPPTASDDTATVDEDTGTNTIDVLVNDTDIDGGPKSVAAVTQPANATVVNNTTDVGYEPDTHYCNDGSPTDDFSYTLNGGSTASVSVAVTCVNDAPMFTAGGDVSVPEDSGAFSQPWASAISPGPANESGQSVNFNVSNDNNALFSTQPAIDPSGTLIFTPAADTTGSAEITVIAEDDGGTSNGGVDQSAPAIFQIEIIEGVDVSVEKTLTVNGLQQGAQLTYNIEVGNAGPSDIAGVLVENPPPPELDNASWTCVAQNGASCGSANGSGPISVTVDLPEASSVSFVLEGTIPEITTNPITSTASATLPAGSNDVDMSNNSDTLSIALRIFSDSFEN